MAYVNRNLVGLIVFTAAMAVLISPGVEAAKKDPVTDYTVFRLARGREAFQCNSNPNCLVVKVCPSTCRRRNITTAGNSACFMDCVACRISCKHRKLNCAGFGAVCYDPRFIGADGVMFYFHGKKNEDFCILSDKNLHINARFIGKRPEGRTRDFTWVQALGIMFENHQLNISANKVAVWNNKIDQLSMWYDGEEIIIPQTEGSLWISASGKVVIERTTKVNSVHVEVEKLMDLTLDVIPIRKEDNRVHKYNMTADDCFAHLQMQFNFFHLSTTVDGVLGQTYQPNYYNPVKRGVPMPIMGGDEKFKSSSLFSPDCKTTQFSASTAVGLADNLLPSSIIVQCDNMQGRGLACRR